MFQSWRLQLREAETALQHGQLDEAGRLLQDANLREFLPAKKLGMRVGRCMAERAGKRIAVGNSSAGWRDLESAKCLVGETDQVLSVRQTAVNLATAEVERHLKSGDTQRALSRLERLKTRNVVSDDLRALREVACRMDTAQGLTKRGKFAEAVGELEAASKLRPDLRILRQMQAELNQKAIQARQLNEKLHRAIGHAAWSKVLTVADRMLELAPACPVAHQAKQRAWSVVGQEDQRSPGTFTRTWIPPQPARGKNLSTQAENIVNCELGTRFLMWVDAVGGFLVCLDSQISLGQAIPGNVVTIPIQGDLSRQHAKIIRQGEGYLIEPLAEVHVEGSRIEERTLLTDGDVIELGRTVKIRFGQPHALSATARLDFLSNHRTQPKADSILLMGESCVLGPRPQNHIICRNWSDDLVFYRQDERLHCRAMAPFEIDNQVCEGNGPIQLSSHICGDDFSLSLEPV